MEGASLVGQLAPEARPLGFSQAAGAWQKPAVSITVSLRRVTRRELRRGPEARVVQVLRG